MFEITADELPRFMQCNASINFRGDGAIRTQTIREEGIAAHWLALQVFSGQVGDTSELVDRQAPNKVYITAEMAEHVDQYLHAIISRRPGSQRFGKMEHDTSFADSSGKWSVNGRVDHIEQIDNTLYVDDLKYGYSIVEPKDNWTLIAHALGWCQTASVKPDTIVLTIHQPRPWHTAGKKRYFTLSLTKLVELYGILRDTLSNPSNTLQSGPKCHRCPGVGNCPAATKAGLNAVEVIDAPFADSISSDGLAELADILSRAQDMVKVKLEAVQELIQHRIATGQTVPNYHLEKSIGNRRWNDGITPTMLFALLGKDLSKPGLVTPAQAEKLGVPKSVVDGFTNRPSNGTKLIRENASDRAKRIMEGQ